MSRKAMVLVFVLLGLILMSNVAFAASELRVIVWSGYYSNDVIKGFEKAHNAKVTITQVDTYEQVFNLLKTPEKYDLLITGELAFPELIKNGSLEPLNKNLIPNMKNLDPLFKGLSFDPDNKYTLPYHYIYIGLLYNKSNVKPAEATLKNFFEAPAKFKGRITTFPNKRIMIGMALKYMGKSFNSTNKKDLDLVKVLLQNVKANTTVKGKNMERSITDNIFEIINGEADLAIGYAAESVRKALKADNVGMLLPAEGANVGTDDMAIVKNAKNKDLAHKFINYLYDPKNAATSVNQIGNPIPVKGVKDLLSPELKNNPAVYPPAEIVKKLEFPLPMTQDELIMYEKLWDEVFGK